MNIRWKITRNYVTRKWWLSKKTFLDSLWSESDLECYNTKNKKWESIPRVYVSIIDGNEKK